MNWWCMMKKLISLPFLLDKIWGCRLMECVISYSPPPQTPLRQQLFLILNEPWAMCWNFHTKVLEIYFSTSLAQEASALRNCNSYPIKKGDLTVALGTNPSSTECCNPLSLLLAMSGEFVRAISALWCAISTTKISVCDSLDHEISNFQSAISWTWHS